MNKMELIEHGLCPNGHGEMVYFKKPIDILYQIPEELCEHLEGQDSQPGMYGYIVAVCQDCGFVLKVENIENQERYLEWLVEYRRTGGKEE